MQKNELLERLKMVEFALLNCMPEENFYMPTGYETAHNVGRWWEAILLLEDRIGTVIPPRLEKGMQLNIRLMMGNSYGLLVNDAEVQGNGRLNWHNLREGLLALTALTEFRKSRWASQCAERLLDTIDRRFFEHTLTDDDICDTLGIPLNDDPMLTRTAEDPYPEEDYTGSTGRAIEGMLEFYRVTGNPRALQVAEKAVAFHRVHSLREDGSAPEWLTDPAHVGHNHSYLGTLRGLLLYGIRFDDKALVDAVYNTFCNSLFKHNCSPSGWAPHDLGKLRFPDHLGDPFGDHASCTDIAYLAFLLACYGGHPELLDVTERLIRARLFTCQVTNGISRGSWGTYDGYFGGGVVLDVFALIAGTLAILYADSVVEKEDGIWVRLLFSAENAAATVSAFRDDRQHLYIVPHKSGPLHVRIPQWCDETTLRITDNLGNPMPFEKQGVFAVIPAEAEQGIQLSFDLPLTETTETTWISNVSYRLFWKGDDLCRYEEILKESV